MHQLALDAEDEARARDKRRAAQEAVAVAQQSVDFSELSATVAHDISQPLAAIIASAHACSRWLSAEPPNIERARLAAERIIRDASAAAEATGRLRGGGPRRTGD